MVIIKMLFYMRRVLGGIIFRGLRIMSDIISLIRVQTAVYHGGTYGFFCMFIYLFFFFFCFFSLFFFHIKSDYHYGLRPTHGERYDKSRDSFVTLHRVLHGFASSVSVHIIERLPFILNIINRERFFYYRFYVYFSRSGQPALYIRWNFFIYETFHNGRITNWSGTPGNIIRFPI